MSFNLKLALKASSLQIKKLRRSWVLTATLRSEIEPNVLLPLPATSHAMSPSDLSVSSALSNSMENIRHMAEK